MRCKFLHAPLRHSHCFTYEKLSKFNKNIEQCKKNIKRRKKNSTSSNDLTWHVTTVDLTFLTTLMKDFGQIKLKSKEYIKDKHVSILCSLSPNDEG